jgi:hypothetical protein
VSTLIGEDKIISRIEPFLDAGIDRLYAGLHWWARELKKRFRGKGDEHDAPKTQSVSSERLADVTPLSVRSSFLQLAASDLFQIRKSFPWSARKRLREAVALQIEHLVPLASEDVMFEFSARRSEVNSSKVDVDIVMVRKPFLEDLVQRIQKEAPNVEVIVASGTEGACNSLVFWKSAAMQKRQKTRRMHLLLILFFVVVFWLFTGAIRERWEKIEDVWGEAVAQKQVQAAQTRDLRVTVEKMQARLNGLQARKNALDIRRSLALVSEVLPDTAFATALVLHGAVLRLEGQSKDVSELEKIFREDERFEGVQFTYAQAKKDTDFILEGRIIP